MLRTYRGCSTTRISSSSTLGQLRQLTFPSILSPRPSNQKVSIYCHGGRELLRGRCLTADDVSPEDLIADVKNNPPPVHVISNVSMKASRLCFCSRPVWEERFGEGAPVLLEEICRYLFSARVWADTCPTSPGSYRRALNGRRVVYARKRARACTPTREVGSV